MDQGTQSPGGSSLGPLPRPEGESGFTLEVPKQLQLVERGDQSAGRGEAGEERLIRTSYTRGLGVINAQGTQRVVCHGKKGGNWWQADLGHRLHLFWGLGPGRGRGQ